ncbi:hypothetical protein Tco_1261332, partial [Tanacetum coccineum]
GTDNPGNTMEEYIQFETERALKIDKDYDWETTKYGMVNWHLDDVDINILRFFETKFPAIVYNDALKLKHDLSFEPTLDSHLAWKWDAIILLQEPIYTSWHPVRPKLFYKDRRIYKTYSTLHTDDADAQYKMEEVTSNEFERKSRKFDSFKNDFNWLDCDTPLKKGLMNSANAG